MDFSAFELEDCVDLGIESVPILGRAQTGPVQWAGALTEPRGAYLVHANDQGQNRSDVSSPPLGLDERLHFRFHRQNLISPSIDLSTELHLYLMDPAQPFCWMVTLPASYAGGLARRDFVV